MAIQVGDYIELVVRLDVIKECYPGGVEGLIKDYPYITRAPSEKEHFACMDEHLAYIFGAMSGRDMDYRLAEFEEKLGRKIARYENRKPVEFINAFITEMCHMTLPCSWARPVPGHIGCFEWIPEGERRK